MIWLFAVALVLGMAALIVWALRQAGRGEQDAPGTDLRGPQIIAGAIAFGMGGMSASYAGWNPWWAITAAVAAGAVGVLLARRRPTIGDRDRA